MLCRAPSRGGRGCRAAADFRPCFGCGVFFRVIFAFSIFFFERARPAASMRPPCFMYLSTSTRVRTGCHYLIILSCLSVCMCNIRVFYGLPNVYESHSHKPGIRGIGLVWAEAWDVFCCTLSRGGRGRQAAVDFVVRFGCGGISFFYYVLFCRERTRPAASMRPPCLIYLSNSKDAVFAYRQKTFLVPGCVQCAII